MSRIILFNKPLGVLCQFTGEPAQRTLADFIAIPDVYAAGRLDADSEGLLVLTDDGRLQHRIADPRHKQPKTYFVQVEGLPGEDALDVLRAGVNLNDGVARSCKVALVDTPSWLWPRHPPIRVRQQIPTCWLRLELTEGRNRQVRRMTAKIGFPTLRLIRWSVSDWNLASLQPGEFRELGDAHP